MSALQGMKKQMESFAQMILLSGILGLLLVIYGDPSGKDTQVLLQTDWKKQWDALQMVCYLALCNYPLVVVFPWKSRKNRAEQELREAEEPEEALRKKYAVALQNTAGLACLGGTAALLNMLAVPQGPYQIYYGVGLGIFVIAGALYLYNRHRLQGLLSVAPKGNVAVESAPLKAQMRRYLLWMAAWGALGMALTWLAYFQGSVEPDVVNSWWKNCYFWKNIGYMVAGFFALAALPLAGGGAMARQVIWDTMESGKSWAKPLVWVLLVASCMGLVGGILMLVQPQENIWNLLGAVPAVLMGAASCRLLRKIKGK